MSWPPPPLARYLVVDNVSYKVPEWIEPGHSFFLPCLVPKRMMQAVTKHYAIRGFKFTHAETTSKNILGVRVWRVL